MLDNTEAFIKSMMLVFYAEFVGFIVPQVSASAMQPSHSIASKTKNTKRQKLLSNPLNINNRAQNC